MELSKAETQWAEQIAARLPKYLERGLPMTEAVQKAHNELQDFVGEMAVGQTRRAKMAAKVISTSAYITIRNRSEMERTIRDCERIDAA